MNEEITPDVFSHLVELAALELSEGEAAYLRGQLNKQLDIIHELEAIDLPEGTPITSHGVPYSAAISPPPREDKAQPQRAPERILDQAPQSEDGYYRVPDIPHTDLA
jgi:aspartyl-tRNA(Asn)/glutamyl-tRNA(Gln) amidotransferase subunit C